MHSTLFGERFSFYEDIKKLLDEWTASKKPISFFEESVYYLQGGRKLSIPMEHTLFEIILHVFV